MIRMLSWNLNRQQPWPQVASEPVDVALLQEVAAPLKPPDVELVPDPATVEWRTTGWKTRMFRTAIARVSERVELRPIPVAGVESEQREALTVSRPGTVTAADVYRDSARRFTEISWYATWEFPPGGDELLGADVSAHRLLSDAAGLLNSA